MEPRAGCQLPVLVELVAPGALVVTWSSGERRFTGILLDCTHRSGLLGLPPPAPLPKAQDPSASWAPEEDDRKVTQLETDPPPPHSGDGPPKPPPALVPPPTGSLPPYPPYFEGAPFPQPLWLRHTYGQWVPQPPPRTIKRTRRRLSRNQAPGRLTLSTIRLRPRRVLCEKCQSTLSPEQARPGQPAAPSAPRRRLGSGPDREPRRQEGPDAAMSATAPARRGRREEERPPGELVPRSPVITISYSNPQGTGEVVKIPSRVHGSLEPFCPPQLPPGGSQDPEGRDAEPRAGGDRPASGPTASIPKLKLTRPAPPSLDAPPPKIRLKPHRPGAGEQEPVYRAELVEVLNGHPASPPALFSNGSSHDRLADLSSGSSGEEDDFKRFPPGKRRRDGLAFLANYPTRKADSASESVCSSDSLDETKSSSSEVTSADACELSPADGAPAPSSSKDTRPTVPPLTVRLHTQSVSTCVTEDGRTVAVGDVVWGKIHGFPWWPARVLDISLSQKARGEPAWQEAKVSWFGSPTSSFLPLSKLAPFSESFKLRFNRKKKGVYRKAITEAAQAARHVAPEVRELLTQFET